MGIATCMYKTHFHVKKGQRLLKTKQRTSRSAGNTFHSQMLVSGFAAIIVSPRHSVGETILPCFKSTYVDKVKTV